MTTEKPKLILIAGCNGAGKTTTAFKYLRTLNKAFNFVNADEIARGLNPLNPESVALEAGRIQLKRIDDLLSSGESFAVETTLSSKTMIQLVRRAKAQGYLFHLIFVYLNSADAAVKRVAFRVASGGHHIPEDVIRRRFVAGKQNFIKTFGPESDLLQLFNNSEKEVVLIAQKKLGQEFDVIELEEYQKFLKFDSE
jgi:predicted ABC-type ATPase